MASGYVGPYPVHSHRGGVATASPSFGGFPLEQQAVSSRVMPAVHYGMPLVASPLTEVTPILGSRAVATTPLLGSRRSVGTPHQAAVLMPAVQAQVPRNMAGMSRQNSAASIASNQTPGISVTPGGSSLHASPLPGQGPATPSAQSKVMVTTNHHNMQGMVHQLTIDLEASRADNKRLAQELEAARSEVEQLAQALVEEKEARQQAEAALLQAEASGERRPASRRGKSPTGQGGDVAPFARPLDDPRGLSKNSNSRRGGSPRGRNTKDEVDVKLNDYLAVSPHCKLEFRRLNRGWYEFRHIDDLDAPTQCVELTMVNGKLMARLEPTSHDPGWNNGKLGSIDRFVMNYS